MSPRDLWARYRKLCCVCDSIGVTLDVSRMKFPTPFSSAWPSTLRRFAEYPQDAVGIALSTVVAAAGRARQLGV
jgi:hypothetical protein